MADNFVRIGGGPILPDSPTYPGYKRIADSKTYLLPSQLTLTPNTQAMDLFRQRAIDQTGISPWTQMQLDSQKMANQGALSQAAKQANLNQVMAMGQMGGGERGALVGLRGNMRGMQGVFGQDLQAKAKIMADAENRRMQNLMALPGMEVSQQKPNQFNIQNALAEKNAEEAAKLAEYAEKMKGYAGVGTARAIIEGSPKGGLFK